MSASAGTRVRPKARPVPVIKPSNLRSWQFQLFLRCFFYREGPVAWEPRNKLRWDVRRDRGDVPLPTLALGPLSLGGGYYEAH